MAKAPLVLIPGLVCDEAVWSHQSEHLGDLAEIIIPDVCGPNTMQEMAATALEVCPPTFALAGFSMGGYVALEMLRQAPGRIGRLALLDTSAQADSAEKTKERHRTIDRCRSGDYSDVIQDMLAVLLHPMRQRDPLAEFVKAMAARVGSDIFVARHEAMMTRLDGRDLIKEIDVPIRAIAGRDDAMSPLDHHAEIATLAKKGRFSIIEDCGHMTILERPQAATALLRDWLLYD